MSSLSPAPPSSIRALPPFYRALLTLDGTVTRFLEAWLDAPVEVQRLSQGPRRLEAPDPQLGLDAGAEVVDREVLLRSAGATLAHARSLLVASRLPAPAREALEAPGASLGRVMDGLRLETYRELLGWGWASALPESLRGGARPAIWRAYCVRMGGQPLMRITETFLVEER